MTGRALERYRNIVMDSARWNGFVFRDDDIVISTPPKCGTTWTQTICASLVFGTPEFPKALDVISPWLDQTLRPIEEVVADLNAQSHRRFIKSHTPLDGLPWDDRVTYVCVARDPRDVALSWENHMQNLNLAAFLDLRAKAVGTDDLTELMGDGPPVPAETEIGRFWQWAEEPASIGREGTAVLGGLVGTLRHLKTFWDVRDRPNVLLLHYGEMKADLEGQMRMIASRLHIDVAEDVWPTLVKAATFEDMRSRAAARAPNATEPIWHSAEQFFHKARVGQWRELLSDEDLARYESLAKGFQSDAGLLEWVHRGPIR